MDLLPDAIFLIGCDSKKIIDANQAACSSVGYSKPELTGCDAARILPDIPWINSDAHSRSNHDNAAPVVICTMLRNKDGREIPVQWTGLIVPAKAEPIWMAVVLPVPRGDRKEPDLPCVNDPGVQTADILNPHGETMSTSVLDLYSDDDLSRLSLAPPGHDSLTGLPDRRIFSIRLDRALKKALQQEQYSFAVLFIDLDKFKSVNDIFGHMAGDHILCKVAWRLVECIRPGDMVARHGGDEFTVFIDRLQDKHTALRVARRISQRLKATITLEGRDISLAGSIGIAFSWQNYTRPEDMLNDADRAMYRAKAKGKSGYEIVSGHAVDYHRKPR